MFLIAIYTNLIVITIFTLAYYLDFWLKQSRVLIHFAHKSLFCFPLRVFLLPCHAIGVRPVLELSNSLVQFGATAVGDRSTAVLFILNSHTSLNDFTHPMPRVGKSPISPVGARFFTFIPPENSEIIVTPISGCVLPGQVLIFLFNVLSSVKP